MGVGRIKGLTIEIGGDTTKLVKALSSVDNAISKTQSNLRDINKALKFDPTNVNLIKDKQRELADQIDQTKQKIETEKEALAQMKNTEGFDANSKAARDLQLQIDLDTAALKQLEAQARESSSVLGLQMQAAGEKIQEVGAKISAIGDKLSHLGQTLTTRVTIPLVTGFATAVKSGAEFDKEMSAVKAVTGATGEEFEQLRQSAMDWGEKTVYTATESAEALYYMGLAGWDAIDSMEALGGVLNLAAAGNVDLGTTSDIVTDAMTAMQMSAKDYTDGIKNADYFTNIMAATMSSSNTDVELLGEAFKYVAPLAGAADFSINDLSLALGLMANNGVKGSQAGTGLRQALKNLIDPSEKVAIAMEKYNVSLDDGTGNAKSLGQLIKELRDIFGDLNVEIIDENGTLKDGEQLMEEYGDKLPISQMEKLEAICTIFGTRAMPGMLAIIEASEEDFAALSGSIDGAQQAFVRTSDGIMTFEEAYKQFGDEIYNNNAFEILGAAEGMAETQMDNLMGAWERFKSALGTTKIEINDLVKGPLEEFLGKATELVKKFNELDDEEQKQILKYAGIAAAIGPVLLVVGKLVSGIGSLVSVFGGLTSGVGHLITTLTGLSGATGAASGGLAALAGPIGIVIAAVAALAAGFVYLYNTNDQFRQKVQETVESLKENFSKVVEDVKPKIEELRQAFDGLMQALTPVFEFILTYIAAIINGIMEAIGPVVELVTNTITIITSLIQAFISFLQGDFDSCFAYLRQALDGFFSAISSIIQADLAFIKGFFNTWGIDLKAIFTTVWNAIKTTIKTKIEEIKEFIQEKWTEIKEWIFETITAILEKFEEIFDKIKEAVSEKITLAKDAIVSGMEEAAEYIKSLPEKFYHWGEEMIQKLIDGIKSKIEAVKQAASELASSISSYIHFSVPDVGPLHDIDSFMPDMVDELVKGIYTSIPRLESAMNVMTGSMASQLQNGASVGGTIATTNTFNINVYGAHTNNNEELVELIEERLAENMMRRGVAFG